MTHDVGVAAPPGEYLDIDDARHTEDPWQLAVQHCERRASMEQGFVARV